MVLIKNWQFFQLFILDKIGQHSVFHDILERKKQQVKKFEKLGFSMFLF